MASGKLEVILKVELLSGAEMVVAHWRDGVVKYILRVPGGALCTSMTRIFRQDDVEHILLRHEQAAAHYALDGYARASARAGGVVAGWIPCPGARTNTILTGIATAFIGFPSHCLFLSAFQGGQQLLVGHRLPSRRLT